MFKLIPESSIGALIVLFSALPLLVGKRLLIIRARRNVLMEVDNEALFAARLTNHKCLGDEEDLRMRTRSEIQMFSSSAELAARVRISRWAHLMGHGSVTEPAKLFRVSTVA